MAIKSIVSSKGQVVIPKKIREIYGLERNSVVIFEPAKDGISLRPANLQFSEALREKLKNFEGDPKFRSSWEKSLKKRLGSW